MIESRPHEPLLTLPERARLESAPWLAALPLGAKHELLRHCRVRILRDKQGVGMPGHGAALYGVASGAVSVRLQRADSEVLDYLPPATWLVDTGAFVAGASSLVVEAHRRATLVSVPAELLRELVRRNASLQQPVLENGCEFMARLMAVLEELAAMPLRQRLARCILRLCESFGAAESHGMRVTLVLSQGEMARMLRASRQRLNLELKLLEAQGALRIGKELLVLDRPALQACADPEAACAWREPARRLVGA